MDRKVNLAFTRDKEMDRFLDNQYIFTIRDPNNVVLLQLRRQWVVEFLVFIG